MQDCNYLWFTNQFAFKLFFFFSFCMDWETTGKQLSTNAEAHTWRTDNIQNTERFPVFRSQTRFHRSHSSAREIPYLKQDIYNSSFSGMQGKLEPLKQKIPAYILRPTDIHSSDHAEAQVLLYKNWLRHPWLPARACWGAATTVVPIK